jgi:hypothetical protein
MEMSAQPNGPVALSLGTEISVAVGYEGTAKIDEGECSA